MLYLHGIFYMVLYISPFMPSGRFFNRSSSFGVTSKLRGAIVHFFWLNCFLIPMKDYFTLSTVKLNIQNNFVSTYVQSASTIWVFVLCTYVLSKFWFFSKGKNPVNFHPFDLIFLQTSLFLLYITILGAKVSPI